MPDGESGPMVTTRIGDQILMAGIFLRQWPRCQSSIDVVVTSPPYNLNLAYGTYDDLRDEAEYIDWLYEVAASIKRVIKPEGSFFLNIAK